jgi:hypothetical protein
VEDATVEVAAAIADAARPAMGKAIISRATVLMDGRNTAARN